jgi:hypothetical protein
MTPPDDPNRRIPVGNSQMTRQKILAALEDYMTFAKDSAAEVLRYVGRLPTIPEQAHMLKEIQRIQGHLGGVLIPPVRALRDDEQQRTTTATTPTHDLG